MGRQIRDFMGCKFPKNCLSRIGERCAGKDQLGRSNAVQRSDPANDRVAKPVALHIDGRRTGVPSESIGNKLSGEMHWLELSMDGRCRLCSMTLPIVLRTVGLIANGGHLERRKWPTWVVTPPTSSCLILTNCRPANWSLRALVRRKITWGVSMSSNEMSSEGRQATKSMLAVAFREDWEILDPHVVSICFARSIGIDPLNEIEDHWWGQRVSNHRNPDDPPMFAVAESSWVFKPPSHHPYSNSNFVGWRTCGWVNGDGDSDSYVVLI